MMEVCSSFGRGRLGMVRGRLALFAVGLVLGGATALAQDPPADPPSADVTTAEQPRIDPTEAPQIEITPVVASPNPIVDESPETLVAARQSLWDLPIWPELNGPTVAWLSVLAIVALTFRWRRGDWPRALDGIVLALASIALLIREMPLERLAPDGHSWRWWGFAVLAGAAAYWAARGLMILSGRAPRIPVDVEGGASWAFLLVGIFLTLSTLHSGVLTPAAVDAFRGGMHVRDTKGLPYGDLPGSEARSPLVYLTTGAFHSAFAPAELAIDVEGRDEIRLRVHEHDATFYSDQPLRMWHTVLVGMTVLGLGLIGVGLQSGSLGAAMGAIFLLFPGTRESLHDTELLLATALLTWSVAFWFVPVAGSLLGTLALVLAGFVWPWAWLGLPAMLAYSLRRGWPFIGALLGFLGGLAAIGAITANFVRPTLPRADGMLDVAGTPAKYVAEYQTGDGGGQLVLYRAGSDAAPSIASAPTARVDGGAHWLAAAIQWLLYQESVPLDRGANRPGRVEIVLPPEMSGATVMFQDVAPADERARQKLQEEFRPALDRSEDRTRFAAAVRTVIESTWRPVQPTADFERSAWQTWGAFDPARPAWLDWSRRGLKILAVALSVFAAVGVLISRVVRFPSLSGGLALVLSVALVAGTGGAGAHWVWLLPILLAAHASTRPVEVTVVATTEPVAVRPIYGPPGKPPVGYPLPPQRPGNVPPPR